MLPRKMTDPDRGKAGRCIKSWKELVIKDMNDLHLKPTDAMDGGELEKFSN